jgi:hypothetical protein
VCLPIGQIMGRRDELVLNLVSCHGYFVAFSEAARVCGKARRAGKGHSLAKRRNADHGRAQPRPTGHVIRRERLCVPITALRSFAMAHHDAIVRLALGTHRRSEYGKIPVTGHQDLLSVAAGGRSGRRLIAIAVTVAGMAEQIVAAR